MGLEICLGALMVGRPFLFPPLLRDIFDRSSDIVLDHGMYNKQWDV